MALITFNPSSFYASSYTNDYTVDVTYDSSVIIESVNIVDNDDLEYAKFSDTTKKVIKIRTKDNDTSSQKVINLVISAFDRSTYTTNQYTIKITQPYQSNPYIQVIPQSVTFDRGGGTADISVSWGNVIDATKAISANTQYGYSAFFTNENKDTIRVNVSPNTSEEDREFDLYVSARTSQYTSLIERKIPVRQKGATEGTITISPNEIVNNWIRGTANANVTLSDIREESIIVNSSEEWLTASLSSDYSKITATFESNLANTPREGVITISGNDYLNNYIEATLIIKQIARPAEGKITASPDNIQIVSPYSGATGSTQLTYTNIQESSVEVRCSDDWLSATIDDNKVLTVTANLNNTSENRKADVIITATETMWATTTELVLPVNQIGNSGINVLFNLANKSHNANQNGEIWSEIFYIDNIDLSTVEVVEDRLPSWVVATIASDKSNVQFVANANTTGNDRECTIRFKGTSTGTVVGIIYYFDYLIFQPKAPETLEFPIWKDTEIKLDPDEIGMTNNLNYINYRLVVNDEVVYNGRAYLKNSESTATVLINDILKEFLKSELHLTVDGMQKPSNSYLMATLQINNEANNENGWIDFKVLRTYDDWTYKYKEHPVNEHYITSPIINKVDDRQIFIFSFADYLDDEIYTANINGVQYVINNEFKTYIKNKPTSDITVDDMTFKVERTNYTYCIYYKNKKGGYSWMLFNRASKQTDKFTFDKLKIDSNNTTLKHSDTIYQTQINETWKLKTDYMNDKQAEKMTELFGSTEMWLHSLEDDIITPVIVTDASAEHLRWANNSKHKIRFDVNIQNSFTKLRR